MCFDERKEHLSFARYRFMNNRYVSEWDMLEDFEQFGKQYVRRLSTASKLYGFLDEKTLIVGLSSVLL